MLIEVKVYQPDGITSRETYSFTLGTLTDDQMTIRDLTFEHLAKGGLGSFSFTIWKDADTVSTVAGDIVKIEVASTLRYVGKIDSISPDETMTGTLYEDKLYVSGRSLIEFADSFNYSLRESDGSEVLTTLQAAYNDLFDGGEYSGKGQDNNVPITAADGIPLITYTEANNTLVALAINVAYVNVPAAQVADDILSLNNGTLDLTLVEPYIYYLKTDGTFHTEQRVTTLLQTFDKDDGDYPTKTAVDLADDGYRKQIDTQGIANKFILNGTEVTSLQYGTEVTSSRSSYGIKQAQPLENKNVTIAEAQKWLDGFILDMLEPSSLYTLRLRKSKFGFSPVWFAGSTNTPNGYIKLTEGGSTQVFNEPFISATYTLDSGGWDIVIEAGTRRPDVDTRSRILTEFTGKDYNVSGTVKVYDPSDTVSDTTFSGIEVETDGIFEIAWEHPEYRIDETNVTFKVYTSGGDAYSGGTLVKTITSATTPNVRQVGNLFRANWFNATSGSKTPGSITIYALGLTNDTIYRVEAEVTLSVKGVDHTIVYGSELFKLKSTTTSDKANDVASRIPDAETDLVKDWDSPTKEAKTRFFTDLSGDAAPDGGAEGWFVSHDTSNPANWIRVGGDLTGTPNDTFTIENDNSAGQYKYLKFESDTGGAVGIIRYDKTNQKLEISVNNGSSYTDITSGVTDKISKTVSTVLYTLEVDATTGDLVFKSDAPAEIFRVTTAGDVKIQSDILPQTTDTYDLGGTSNLFANAYIGNVTYTQDVIGSPDGGSTLNWKIEWDGTNSLAFAYNIAMGFMDDP